MADARISVHVQRIAEVTDAPTDAQFQCWVEAVTTGREVAAAVTLRVISSAEMQMLNHQYRGKPRPTNVLSFPAAAPEGLPAEAWAECGELGDIVFCAEVIRDEALEQGKALSAHWAHMTVHGVLHLLGYDHELAAEAEIMETEERQLLAAHGLPDPY